MRALASLPGIWRKQRRRKPDLRQRGFDDGTQLADVVGLREEDRQLGRRVIRERYIAIGLEEIFHNEREILLLIPAKIDAVNIARTSFRIPSPMPSDNPSQTT